VSQQAPEPGGDDYVRHLAAAMPERLLPALLGQLLRRMLENGQIDGIPGISFPLTDGMMSDAGANFAMNLGPVAVVDPDGRIQQ
jgi:hypothetical protein